MASKYGLSALDTWQPVSVSAKNRTKHKAQLILLLELRLSKMFWKGRGITRLAKLYPGKAFSLGRIELLPQVKLPRLLLDTAIKSRTASV